MTQRSRGVEQFLKQLQARPGYYREFPPSADLLDIVACNWVSVVRPGRFGARTPIIPDGCSDIMLYDAEMPHLVGPDTRMRWTDLRDGLVITGLRLRPGALRAVFRCSALQLLDRQMPLRDLGTVSTRFLDAVNFADNLQQRHALLEDWVRHARQNMSAKDSMLVAACRTLATNTQLPIDTLTRQLDWNVRTMHRQFTAACGYGPKHLQRVMRVQHALRVAEHASRRLRLSDVASSAGFADQAHMTREFKDLTGFTPTAYFAACTPGVGEWLAADLGTGLLSESFKTNAG